MPNGEAQSQAIVANRLGLSISNDLANLIKVVCLLGLALMIGARFVDWDNLFVKGLDQTLNDQVGYVVVARNVATSGAMESPIIYPSTLSQHITHNTLYMPGHYWALAASFMLLGYSVAHSFVPALLAFILSTLMLFLVASRRYGPSIGFQACVVFIFFPMNLIYAFTAMSEMTLLAAIMVAFAMFVLLPRRFQPWLGPLLLVLPLLCRETGAALGAVMVSMFFMESSGGWKKRTLIFTAMSCGVVLLVLGSPFARGRPSLWTANILLKGSFEAVYTNAFAAQGVHHGIWDWTLALARQFRGNVQTLAIPHFGIGAPYVLEYCSLVFILLGIPVGAFLGWRKRDGLLLGAAGMTALLLALDLLCYSVWKYRAMRSLLFCEPFVGLSWVLLLNEVFRSWRASRLLPAVAVVMAATIGMGSMYYVFRDEAPLNAEAASDTRFLESINHDDRTLLVSPYWLSVDYVYKHYPVRWSFVPANRETLELLSKYYPESTLVLPLDGPMPERLSASEITSAGLLPETKARYRGIEFEIFKGAREMQPTAISRR